MTVQSDLVGTSHWTWATRGVARMMSEDFPEYDDPDGVHPYRDPGECQGTRIGELFRQFGGVTVVDNGDLDAFVANMSNAPGLLVAFDGFPAMLPNNPGLHSAVPFIIRMVLKTNPVHESDPTMARRADILDAILARLFADRYQLGSGRIPWPADIDPWNGPDLEPQGLTRCLSHGIVTATTVGPPSRLPGEGDILRDDIEVTFSANMRLEGSGRWRIQE